MSGLPDIYGGASAQTPNYARFPVEFTRGEGSYLYDRDGNEYLDMLCGIGVNSIGHCHPAVVAAIERQAKTLLHASNLFWTEPVEYLARAITARSFGEKVFFCNSGAEANEAAIKLARAAAYGAGRPAREIVVLEGAFHGRTMGALSATPQEDKQAPFAPLVHGFKTAPREDADALAAMITDQTCAVLLEPVQGETGVHPIADDVLIAARAACDDVGAVLIFDEVQCGIGRTGTLFAYEQTPVIPDVMTLAKALGGGLPIGAMVVSERYVDVLQPGYHGSTFGGNPVACAAANAAIEIVSGEGFLERVRSTGDELAERLARFGSVKHRGLMIGVQLDATHNAAAVVERMLLDEKVVINATGPHTLRMLPPLTIGAAESGRAETALASVLAG